MSIKEEVTEKEVQNTINSMRNDLNNIIGFIAGEFVKYAKVNKGEIGTHIEDYIKGRDSLIYANPDAKKNEGKAVLSFTATEKGINKKIQKLMDKGADPELFTDLKNELATTKENLTKQASTTEGLKELIGTRLTHKMVADNIRFMETNELDNPQKVNMTYKGALAKQIEEYVKIPNDVVKNMLQNPEYDKEVQAIASKHIIQAFSATDKEYTLDTNKLNPENIKKFGQEINNALEREIPSHILIRDTLKSMEQKQNIEFTPARVKKITNALKPALAKLNPQYLKEHKEEINQEISKSLNDRKTFLSIFRKEFSISGEELSKLADNITKKHSPLSNKKQATTISVIKPDNLIEKDKPKQNMKRASIEFAKKIRENLQNKFQPKERSYKVSTPTTSKQAMQKRTSQREETSR